MPKTDPRIDAYIANAAEFARPVMEHIRKLVHKAVPDVEETMKWSFPHFEYHGAILCSMAAFKAHCVFGFWKASLMNDPHGILRIVDKNSMGHFDRMTSKKDLPSDKILTEYIKEAARLNEEGVKVTKPAKKAIPAAQLAVPPALAAAFKKAPKAKQTFEAFAPSHRKEYIEWINEAKTDPTRDKRVATTIEWLLEGKARNWKYGKK
jgi:uncharacterized protein YdeI (YjbR/CyaY-like superfamily)